MARSNRPLWVFLLATSPALADQEASVTTSSNSEKDVTARSSYKPGILADEHGTLLADEHGTLTVDDVVGAVADEQGTKVLADEHGAPAFIRQQPLADEHGRLVLDIESRSLPEPE